MTMVMRFLFSLLVFMFAFSLLAQNNENVAVAVDKTPKFKGGDEKLIDFIIQNTIYPLLAQEQNIEGEVVVQFIISPKGTIEHIRVKESINPILDSAAMEVIKKMPNWIPAKKNGKAVSFHYAIPISFTLPKPSN